MIYLLTFADGGIFEEMQNLFSQTIHILGADKHIKYNKNNIIGTEFYKSNKKIFSKAKGFGLYIWKPYIIYTELQKIADGDYIFYCDCSRHIQQGFNTSINYAINYMELHNIDIMPGSVQTVLNLYHSSNECIERIRKDQIFDTNEYKNSFQQTAGHIIIKKTAKSVDFIASWLKYCQVWECIQKKKIPNGFNNCDMSVLNVLLFAHEIKNPHQPLEKEKARDHNNFLSNFCDGE